MKFHDLPLSATIAIEERRDLHQWIHSTGILQILQPWNPLFSGSLPIGVDLPGSDLDILLTAEDLNSGAISITERISKSLIGETLEWQENHSRQGACLVARIKSSPVAVELFLSRTPARDQHSHRHLLSEYQLLVMHGESLRREVKVLKMSGLSSEEAFAKALNLPGNPYETLAEMSQMGSLYG